MKKLLCFLCTLLLLMSTGITAFAEETVLTADIPNTHMVTVKSDHGRVALDGAVCEGRAEVERHREQSYRIIPNAGKQIDKVLYNGEDVTDQVIKSVFTAPKLVRDAELEVVYKNVPGAPDERKYEIHGTVEDENGVHLSGVTVDIGGKTEVTDEDGKFQMKEIPSGTHPVAITDQNGKVLGSSVLIIEKADGNKLTFTVDKNDNPVIKPGKNTKIIDLTIVVAQNGDLKITGVSDSTPLSGNTGNNSPQTGDTDNPNLWLSLLIASGTALLMSYSYIGYSKRRRKES